MRSLKELTLEMKQNAAEQKQSTAELSKKMENNAAELSQKLESNTAEMKQNAAELKQQITEKVDALENKVQRALHEQAVRFEDKLRHHQLEVQRDLDQKFTKFSEKWDEQLAGVKQEVQRKIFDVHEGMQDIALKTMNLETKTTELEVAIETTVKVGQENTKEIGTLKENLKGEVKKLQYEIRLKPTTMWMYETGHDERSRVKFEGNRKDNPIEFLKSCEREIERIGTPLNDTEKIDFVSKHLRDSAEKWFTIVRDNIFTYEQFKEVFENRYWNVHTQRLVRDQLEYGRYPTGGRLNMEQYAIQQTEQCKHLRPPFSEQELVMKLSYHFGREIRLAIYTQGVSTLENLLVLLSQSERLLRYDRQAAYSNLPNRQTSNENERRGGMDERREERPPAKDDRVMRYCNKEIPSKNKGGYSRPNTRKKFTTPYDRTVQAISKESKRTDANDSAKPSTSNQ